MKSKAGIIISLAFFAFSVCAYSQYTNTTILITANSFPDAEEKWFGGGANVKVASLSFYTDDQLIGTIYRNKLITPGNNPLSALLTVSSLQPSLKIIVKYSHHEWNLGGTIHFFPNLEKTFTINPVTLSRHGFESNILTFNQFTGLDQTINVNWTFNYRVRITPYQPAINENVVEFCYDETYGLSLTNNNPVIEGNSPLYDYTGVQYEWQYGYYSTEWIDNPEFLSFEYGIIGYLNNHSPGGNVDCGNIETAIQNTDFSFMSVSYSLYDNLDENKSDIASGLLSGIIGQQSYLLNEEEMYYLSENFTSACMAQNSWPRPVTPATVISQWSDITTTDNTGKITLNPAACNINVVPAKLGIGVHVRAVVNGVAGPYSAIQDVTILPKAPLFTVEKEASCREKYTGIIRLKNVSGLCSDFKCIIRDLNNLPLVTKFFSGSDFTLSELFAPGTYQVDVYYNNASLHGCSVTQTITISQLDELNYDVTTKDASCPEKSDGEISILNLRSASACSFAINGTIIPSFPGKFQNLAPGKYSISVQDICKTKALEYSISQKNIVNVSVSSLQDPDCLSSPNGSIRISASGSISGKYDFELSEGSRYIGTAYNKEPSFLFESLPGGNYKIMAKANECNSYYTSTEKSLVPVQPIDFTYIKKDVNCFGSKTGEIQVTPSGGKPVYHYQLDSNPYLDNPTFGSLGAGTYTVTVHTGNQLCNDVKSKSVTVSSALPIEIDLVAENDPCHDSGEGSLSSEVSGGSGVYSYSWSIYNNGSWKPITAFGNKLAYLNAAKYKVEITDSWGCSVSAEGEVTQPPPLLVESAIPRDVACLGGTGSISIAASGGTLPYTYSCHDDIESRTYTGNVSTIEVPEGSYYISVKDAHNCEAVYDDYNDIIITAPETALDFTMSSPEYNGFNLSCHGGNTGELNIVASGGNGPGYEGYRFSVATRPDNTTGLFNNLTAGTYTVSVTDDRGCIVSKTQIITEPDPVDLSLISMQPVKCFGTSTGQIIVAASGGIVNTYKYKLDGVEMLSTGIFSDLGADSYEIEVTDLNGCSQKLITAVESLNPPIDITITGKDVRCFNEGNGELSALISGGAGGFSCSWERRSGENWEVIGGNTLSMTNLLPGNYRVKATDIESCIMYGNAEIREPSELQISNVSFSDIVCYGEEGRIHIDATGGTAGYTYYCSSVSINRTGPLPDLNVPAGIYSMSVKDANGCMASHPGTLELTSPGNPLDFTASLSSYNGYPVTCNGKTDGIITIEPSGGNGTGYSGYTYYLGDAAGQVLNSFRNLGAGTHRVKISDGRGCTTSKDIILSQPEPVRVNLLSIAPVKCFGKSTGEIHVETNGGVPGYNYMLNGAEHTPGGSFKALPAGDYHVQVSDANGCLSDLSAKVEHKNPPISSLLTSVKVSCYGYHDGEISAELTGGSGSFSASWEKKTLTGWQPFPGSRPDIDNLNAGFYRLKAIDSDNCPDIDSIEVKEPEPLKILSVDIKDAICYGDKGVLGIEATGGNGGYAFQCTSDNNRIIYHDYSPGDSLNPGIYGLRVRDSKGCTYEDPGTVRITSPSAALSFRYELSEYSGYNVSCHGKNDGRINVLASGGNEYGYSGYRYLLSGKPSQEENLFTGLEAGIYELIVNDGRGCRLTRQVTLSQPASEIVLRASGIKKPVCHYDSNGAVTLQASGGSLPYLYSVNNGDYRESPEFTDLPVNTYLFRVKDINGCSETFDTLLQNLVSRMNISAGITDVKCFGENSGSVNLSVSGGAKPYNYSWKENSLRSALATNLSTGRYTALVTDSAGCKSEKEFFVSQPDKPLSVFLKGSPACVGLKNGEITATPQGGTPPYRFDLNRKSDFLLPPVISVYSGNHTVYVADRNDCISEARIYVDVRNAMPDINFMLATSRYELDTLVVIDVSVPRPDKITWEFSPEANVIDTSRNKAMVKYNSSGLYPVRMTGLFGTCAYTVEKLLNIAPFDPEVIPAKENRKGIKSLKISPNPNDGRFELGIDLYTKQQVTVRIFDLGSRMLYSEILPADTHFFREVNLPETVMPGTYVLWVTCENDARSAVFVISK